MTGHTPGPWSSSGDRHARLIHGDFFDKDGAICATRVARIEGNATSQRVTEANARLVAAAPDLLAACIAFLAAYDLAHKDGAATFPGDGVDAMRAAVADALGQCAPEPVS